MKCTFFSVVLAQLRLTLRCHCIDASTSTHPHLSTFRSSHAHIRRSTSPPHHTHTSAHLYHICTSTLSLLHICPVFLSFYISFLSSLCTYIFARSHPQYTSTSISHLHIHTVTPSHPPSLSLFLCIFSTVLDNYMSRSRANRRLVVTWHTFAASWWKVRVASLKTALRAARHLPKGRATPSRVWHARFRHGFVSARQAFCKWTTAVLSNCWTFCGLCKVWCLQMRHTHGTSEELWATLKRTTVPRSLAGEIQNDLAEVKIKIALGKCDLGREETPGTFFRDFVAQVFRRQTSSAAPLLFARR